MFAQERHSLIKKLMRTSQRMSFEELQSQIKVSPATLRRDLTELEKNGDLIRVHGGILDPAYVRSEISFDERVLKNSAAKRALARHAAAMIPAGAVVFVDAGSTCLEIGRLLLGRKEVRILTHSVALIHEALRAEAEVIAVGGELRKVSGALIGAAALADVSRLHADFAFIGASGMDDSGCSTTELFEAEMKRAILRRADHGILAADSSKWAKPSTVRFAEWSCFQTWIVEQKPPVAELRKLPNRSLKVFAAK